MNNKVPNNKRKSIKIVLIIFLVLLIIFILLLGGSLWYINNKLSKMQRIDIDVDDVNINKEVEENLYEYRNIVLFGIDSRENNLESGNRSDCIIIVSINNNTKEVKLVSVYRDTYLNIDGYGLDKINHAYSYGSAKLAISSLNKNLDLNIKEFVTVNFDVLAEIVDLLGGINVEIEQEELKPLNETIESTSKILGKEVIKISSKGNKNLSGVQAVAYSRIRDTDGGDYKRTERMRKVIEAIFEKSRTKSFGELDNIVNEILPKMYTNIESKEIVKLIPSILDYKIVNSIGWPYEVKGITLYRWYGVPVTLEENVTRLHKELFSEENYSASQTVINISNEIINKTGYY